VRGAPSNGDAGARSECAHRWRTLGGELRPTCGECAIGAVDWIAELEARNQRLQATLALHAGPHVTMTVQRANELEEAERELETLRALLPGQHRHSFTWTTSNTYKGSPPPDVACVCGLTWLAVQTANDAAPASEPKARDTDGQS
jgi:hypothetical protein